MNEIVPREPLFPPAPNTKRKPRVDDGRKLPPWPGLPQPA